MQFQKPSKSANLVNELIPAGTAESCRRLCARCGCCALAACIWSSLLMWRQLQCKHSRDGDDLQFLFQWVSKLPVFNALAVASTSLSVRLHVHLVPVGPHSRIFYLPSKNGSADVRCRPHWSTASAMRSCCATWVTRSWRKSCSLSMNYLTARFRCLRESSSMAQFMESRTGKLYNKKDKEGKKMEKAPTRWSQARFIRRNLRMAF